MSYTDALNKLDSRNIGTDYNSKLDRLFFFTNIQDVGEVRLLVEDEGGDLLEDFEVRSPEESMGVVIRHCASQMYINLEDLEEVTMPPYGHDEVADFYEMDKGEDDMQRYLELHQLPEKF